MDRVGNLREFSINNICGFLNILKYFHCLHLSYLDRKWPKTSLAFQVSQVLSLRISNHILYC